MFFKWLKLVTKDKQIPSSNISLSLQWCHNEREGVSHHRRLCCLLNLLLRLQIKENIKAPRYWPLWWPEDPHHKNQVTRKMVPFDDVIMYLWSDKTIYVNVTSWRCRKKTCHALPQYFHVDQNTTHADSAYHVCVDNGHFTWKLKLCQ